ncbi:MAG TPA: SET domain-containing protein [Nanoarchaeota archaeon]|nr:SET domain-containing protein [Nanoarchaeota archaeon]
MIHIKNSSIEGKGIFASSDIKKGEIICHMTGNPISVEELKKRYVSGEVRVDDPFQIKDDTYLLLDSPYLFINHSCSPNSGIREVSILVAIKDIKKEEEITYDYSTTEWSDRTIWGIDWQEKWIMKCNCKSDNCRKEVKEFFLLPDELKKDYSAKKILPSFILEKINKNLSF